MSIFKTRKPQRDRGTDRQRLSRLTTLLRTMIDGMRTERDSLEAKRRKTEEEAAFSRLAFEEGGGGHMSAKLNDLTASLAAATDRLKSLQDQIAFASRLIEETTVFGASSLREPERRQRRLSRCRQPSPSRNHRAALICPCSENCTHFREPCFSRKW